MELQKDDITLPGGLGSAIIDGKVYDVVEKVIEDHGTFQFASTRLTMRPVQPHEQKTEDAEFEIVKPKEITNGDGDTTNGRSDSSSDGKI